MEKSLQKIAKKFIKQLNGIVAFDTVADYLQKTGYTVIYYSSPECPLLVEEYELSDYRNSVDAFTYVSDSASIVFINDKLHHRDMLCSLLHEAAHIFLGHLAINPFIIDNRGNEMEAEALAYAIMNYKKSYVHRVAIAGVLGVAITALIFLILRT